MTETNIENSQQLESAGSKLVDKNQRAWTFLKIAGLAVTYFVTAEIGLAYAIPPGNATAVWPASGVALSALLIFGVRIWPGVWIGAWLLNTTTTVSIVTAAGFATGNTLEALLAAWLCIKCLDLKRPFRQLNDGFVFAAIAVCSAALAATFGTASLFYGGYIDADHIYANWSTWWLGDVAGIMLVTPFFLVLPPVSSWHLRSRTTINAFLSLAFLWLISRWIFGGWLSENRGEGLLYLPLIIVFWLLLKFHSVVVFAGNLTLAAIAIAATAGGIGPFATEAVDQSLFDLQIFMGFYAMSGLTLSGILNSGRDAQQRQTELAARIESAERLRIKEEELAHVSRLSMMGEMVAGIAHEINQPLYAISNFAAASAHLIGDAEEMQNLRDLNQQITGQAVRAGDIIKRLRSFVGKSDGIHAVLLVQEPVDNSIRLLASEIDRRKASVRRVSADPSLRVKGDRIQIEQILINLIRNALDAIADTELARRIIDVTMSQVDDEVQVSVQDQGIGLSQQITGKLFDPFFTTKESGMGMGLAISRTLIEAHGGRIWAEPRPVGGTIVTFTLPLHQGD